MEADADGECDWFGIHRFAYSADYGGERNQCQEAPIEEVGKDSRHARAEQNGPGPLSLLPVVSMRFLPL